MKYLVDMTYWDEQEGPIIFYAGNEGDIETFFENSGFMTTTLAEQFKAITVFAEHRYFGESMPFGDQSFDTPNLVYLTVEQTMMDYVKLVQDIKINMGLQNRAVIVGGGSYGGMLSAWIRMKYPQWF
jgi:lysosomal Pro-X carboxypeptidase